MIRAAPLERELTRRGVLAAGALGALGVAGALRALEDIAAAAPAGPAALAADSDPVRATMAAFADTIIPGRAGGADRRPGAVEAGAVDEIYDPFYGVTGAFPVLHTDLQLATPRVLGRSARFDLQLPYRARERVMRDRITEFPAGGGNPVVLGYQAVAILVYLAYVGTAQSRLGPRTMGFPPASDGYYPGHSYGVRFRGMTRDGNPR